MFTQFYPYSVTVCFANNLPPFSCRLYAENEEHAKVIAVYEAQNHGWPAVAESFTVERID